MDFNVDQDSSEPEGRDSFFQSDISKVATTSKPRSTDSDEPTCRICRGEGSEDEPLFHPCKCSGSIKYIHQECLAEWLKHSQKKPVCELCHTQFSFTKVYSNDMPTEIPFGIFIKEGGIRALKSVFSRVRFAVVMFIWIFLLPLCTRKIIKGYFWISSFSVENLANSSTIINGNSNYTSFVTFPSFIEDIPQGTFLRGFIVDTIEGQIFTIAQLLIFLVLFLSREWIVHNGEFVMELQRLDAEEAQRFIALNTRGEAPRAGDDQVDRHRRRADAIQALLRDIEVQRGVQQDVGFAGRNEELMRVLRRDALIRANDLLRHENLPIIDNEDHTDDEIDNGNIDHNGNDEHHGREFAPDFDFDDLLMNAAPLARNEDGIPAAEVNVDADIDADANVIGDFEEDDVAEDFDGVFNILGARGPLINAVQSIGTAIMAIFASIGLLMWFPYMIGVAACYLITPLPYEVYVHLFKSSLYYINNFVDLMMSISYIYLSKIFKTSFFAQSAEYYLKTAEERSKSFSMTKTIDFSSILHHMKYLHAPFASSRFWSKFVPILVGYTVLIFALMYYVTSSWRFGKGKQSSIVERYLLMFLRQAGAILKVVFIISIELVFFPLYCGILLDGSLLPLLDNTTLTSRYNFAENQPLLSILLHWASGTYYMVMFAVFVTVCREIMRPGVLYFVRDPNDPNFHPIRDILKRKLRTQVYRISLSGVIYSILICCCIGGTTWVLRHVINASFLPLIIPNNSEFLNTKSAHMISSYLFIILIFKYVSPRGLIKRIWIKLFSRGCNLFRLSSFILNVNVPSEQGTIKYNSIKAWISGKKPEITVNEDSVVENTEAYFVRNGSFVRAPGIDALPSDKGYKLFIPVTKDDVRLDGEEDTDNDLDEYTIVYRPPQFRCRVAGFLCFIWFFSAIGISAVTILSLLIGRKCFGVLFSSDSYNDVFALSVGGAVVSTLIYLIDYLQQRLNSMASANTTLVGYWSSGEIGRAAKRGVKLFIYCVMFYVVFPVLFSTCLNTIMGALTVKTLVKSLPSEPKVDQFLFSLILGNVSVQYFFMDILPNRFAHSKLARDFNALNNAGIFEYDLYRAIHEIFLPIMGLGLFLLFAPLGVTWAVVKVFFRNAPKEKINLLFRYSHTVLFAVVSTLALIHKLKGYWRDWNARVRDNVYLVGEQLQNLGD